MNKYEFENPNRLKNDMKKRFDENTEFAKEFTSNQFENYDFLDKENYEIDLNDNNKKETKK